ncbi:hypothetical protein ACFVAG_26255 [Streptomyces sp. NPDC057644]|uniref:TRADD-N-associated membrane domain-containing protein n=1 Tax=Streptomyces sp. NPDC057644 TaxID=3346191 RepID=UPI0036B714F5
MLFISTLIFQPERNSAWGIPALVLSLMSMWLVIGAFVWSFRIWEKLGMEKILIQESRDRLVRAEGRLENALRHDYLSMGEVGEEGEPPFSEEFRGRRTLPLAELWETTHARLNHYHEIATGQARTSFRNAQFAMGIGFVLLVAFVILSLNASTTAGTVVAGGLGAVSAALAGFVGRTFIRSQEAAAKHLRSYFDQPLELSRYLAAERLIADAEMDSEQRTAVLTSLVQAMVAPPVPPERQERSSEP